MSDTTFYPFKNKLLLYVEILSNLYYLFVITNINNLAYMCTSFRRPRIQYCMSMYNFPRCLNTKP